MQTNKCSGLRRSFLALTAILLVPINADRWRWEDRAILGMFCMNWMQPWFCLKDRAAHYIEGCALGYNDTQLDFVSHFYYETGNTASSGPLYDRGWLNGCDYCTWDNITCNEEGNITVINITDTTLTGTLTTEIGYLYSLESLILHSNEFTGNIPSEIASIYNLTQLELHYNNFQGWMPDEVCDMGGVNGQYTWITADCGRPGPEVRCRVNVCCDACYIDSLRPGSY